MIFKQALLCLVAVLILIPTPVAAISPDDKNAIYYDTGWYGQNSDQCTTSSSSSSGGGPLLGLKFPSVSDTDALAKAIDKYILKTNPGSPFRGHGDEFVRLGQKYNVNPALGVTQAQIESQLGTSQYARDHNNAYGLGGSNAIDFPNMDASTSFYFKLLKKDYIGPPNNFTTLEQLIHKYAPKDDGNNEAEYVQTIKTIMKQITDDLSPEGSSGSTAMNLINKFTPSAYAASGGTAVGEGLGGALQGHYIPAAKGGTGEEGDDRSYAFDSSPTAEEDQWHINMRWRFVTWDWYGTSHPDGPERSDNFFTKDKHPRVLVTNPRTHKNIITSVIESGPAPWTGMITPPSPTDRAYIDSHRPAYWNHARADTPNGYTGRVSGMLPGALQALGARMRMADGSGDDLLYAWAPDQNAPLGPTDTSVGDQSNGTCNQANDSGNANFIKKNKFPDRTATFTPTMLVLHYSETEPSQGIDGLVSALKSNTSCGPGGCAVQVGIDAEGKVYQLTNSLNTLGAHVYNFNSNAIGIEIIGKNEQQLLNNEAQFNAVVAASVKIMKQYNIQVEADLDHKKGLVGHLDCDAWSEAHRLRNDGHTDPGRDYMRKAREAIKQELGQ